MAENPSTTNPAIKPCPFCGKGDISFVVRHPSYGQCETCGTEGPSASTVKGAIAEWNDRRSTEADREATIEECAKVALADYPVHARPDSYGPGIKVAIASAIRALRRAGESE